MAKILLDGPLTRTTGQMVCHGGLNEPQLEYVKAVYINIRAYRPSQLHVLVQHGACLQKAHHEHAASTFSIGLMVLQDELQIGSHCARKALTRYIQTMLDCTRPDPTYSNETSLYQTSLA